MGDIFVAKQERVFQHYVGKILDVCHWIKPGQDSFEKAFSIKYKNNIFEYTGTRGNYCALVESKGPRLDIQIEVSNCPFFSKFIEVNIYSEVMEIIKYKRMSPKLYQSFEKNIGKSIDIYIYDNKNIRIDIIPLFSLNYGYKT